MAHQQQNQHLQQRPYVQPGEPLHDFLRAFWQRQVDSAERETTTTLDYRHPPLPLARIKKVMKSDPEVKMIAADAPILFCKACEIFIAEITSRAFIVADSNKRRTLSRSDISKALSKSDQFDFLIDIVPRDEAGYVGPSSTNAFLTVSTAPGTPMEVETPGATPAAAGQGQGAAEDARGGGGGTGSSGDSLSPTSADGETTDPDEYSDD